MVTYNKIILRSILLASYIGVVALIIFGISSVFAYLNTGADRSTLLHTEVKKIDQYLPKVIWEPLNNEGRVMDMQTLNAIEKDYLSALYLKHIAYKNNITIGLDDYYTESARENLYRTIATNNAERIVIEATTLAHHPKLDFFSEDGQLAVITDKNVIEYKRIYKNNVLVFETTEEATYKIVVLLEDGFWRIRHIVAQDIHEHIEKTIETPKINTTIKGINYYPKDTPWDMYTSNFDEHIIAKDFEIIKNAGLNTIRLFVPYKTFGKANLIPEKLEKLQCVLDIAEANKLNVVLTLFDFYGDYSVLNWTLNQRYAETIVSRFKNHKAIYAWDIKNEPDLDFNSRGKTMVIAWLKQMLILIKTIDNNHPVTIGWSSAEAAPILKNYVDFVSFHYYKDIANLATTFNTLKQTITDKPIVISEFGLSSYKGLWNPFGNSPTTQANYHKNVQKILKKNNIPFLSWTLYDYKNIPRAVVGKLPWKRHKQKHYGFIDTDGVKKPSFQFITN